MFKLKVTSNAWKDLKRNSFEIRYNENMSGIQVLELKGYFSYDNLLLVENVDQNAKKALIS